MSGSVEKVAQTPIYINGRLFNPSACVHEDAEDYSGDKTGVHRCVHDWRVYWGNQDRPLK